MLFDLLDAMDGAAPDADLLFVLTTNRADLLEPALAARPGRIDVAVEVDPPDAAARRELLRLYGRDVPLRLTDDDVTRAVERTDGVTASFLEELLRRAVLESLHEQDPVVAVTGAHLDRALDDLLDSTQRVTRTLLGVGADGVVDGDGAEPALAPAFSSSAGYRPTGTADRGGVTAPGRVAGLGCRARPRRRPAGPPGPGGRGSRRPPRARRR